MKKQVITATSAVVLGSTLFAGAASAQTITVKKGDTLWGFSKKYGTTVSKIKQENKLKSDIIYIGQRLSINGSSSSSAKASKVSSATHKVVKGDSLWKISRTYGMTVNELKTLNGLKTDLIRIGQVLKVKGTKSVKARSTTKPSASSGTSKTSAPAQKSSTLNTSKLVSDAKALIGTPYKWGGTSTSGFDCGGFVWYILNKQTNVARTNTVGYWNSMKSVSSPAVGDFVFFTTYQPGPSHMGVYIGNNQFVHAGSDGVTISDMTNSYWKPRYLGAKRF
nr:LysM peptidoglycan-binding domain-containing protein [Bacillus licheniformis]